MKKIYISPKSIVVRVKTRSAILTTSYSSTEQASESATVFSRETSFGSDEE